MSANPHANGGELLRDLVLPDFRDYAVDVPEPGKGRARRRRCWALSSGTSSSGTRRTSGSSAPTKPPPTACRRVFDVTGRTWEAELEPTDEGLSHDGRVMEVLI